MATTRPCEVCGISVTRCASQMREHVFCSRKCASVFTSKRMSDMNAELNPDRMVLSTRLKLKAARTKEDSTCYGKTFGRHTHRVVAEQMLGRPLKQGEVVHHIDRNRRNNDPSNLMIFPSQAEHALWHRNETLWRPNKKQPKCYKKTKCTITKSIVSNT